MIEKREKRKKIFYVPGMISLVFIPLFCLYHFYKVDAFKVYNSIELSMPYENNFEKYKFSTLRKYKEFSFARNHSEKKKLNEMRLYLRKLRVEKDTVNGIKIHFGLKSNYQTFISTLDILAEEEAPTWVINKNDIYVLGSSNVYKKVKDAIEHHTMNCGTGEVMRRQAYWAEKQAKEEEMHSFQTSFLKQKWKSLSLGYLGLVFLNIFILVKFNKTKFYNQK
ncbi:hypothetical protein EYY60_05635 [Flavobacterium zhairuonense]|uniref:hypothetical protein n=1 Tax=Flavobacterium zhairuonense TaxID=2493631 RepID=UPI00104450DF|nr:hypothetical protein [Flavobacterium zhairuonense]KAF2513708.1 hypothetical protein EYY60_05635 [Flavobacterium zhairuonense]